MPSGINLRIIKTHLSRTELKHLTLYSACIKNRVIPAYLPCLNVGVQCRLVGSDVCKAFLSGDEGTVDVSDWLSLVPSRFKYVTVYVSFRNFIPQHALKTTTFDKRSYSS